MSSEPTEPTAQAAPTLPIKNRSTVTKSSGRTPKKGGLASTKNSDGRRGGHKAWADFTPTPWVDFAPTPWSNTAGGAAASPFPAYPAATGKKGKKDGPGPWPMSPTASPTSWGATPTPSSAQSIQQSFGIMPPMIGGIPPMPANIAAMAHFAAAAAGAAAAAAFSAHMNPYMDSSPEDNHMAHGYGMAPWVQAPADVAIHKAAKTSGSPSPSKGSAEHGAGTCRPCAWFWKPGGCQSGAECNYCHLCPEGELKNRKKAKVAAMRMGVLSAAPAVDKGAGAPRTLKLTSLV